MATALLETKLHAPRSRRRLVERPRLADHLGRAAGAKLTLVSAPPGFGKTTLIADWLASSDAGPSSAWVSLDATDSDRVSFWRYVLTAMRAASPKLGDRPLAALEASPQRVEAALQSLLNELTALPGDLVLVLDDFHVIEGREVVDDLAFFLDHLPPPVHVVITTRADPALPLSRLRARGDLVEIRAADLRFTPEEAAEYLNESMDLAFGMMRVQSVGRQSGRPRTAIVGYYEDGPNLVTLAMNGWGDADPAWWLNLQARPDTIVDLAGGPRPVRARSATPAERERLWATFDDYPGWGADIDALAARRPKETTIVVFAPRTTGAA